MQAATSLQYSYSEMGVHDHLAVGPDAVDVILWGISNATHAPVEQPTMP